MKRKTHPAVKAYNAKHNILSGAVLSQRYDGVECVLIDDDGDPVTVGQQVTSFRDEEYAVTDGRAPHKADSSGRVYVYRLDETEDHEESYFPGVFELRWVPAADYLTGLL